MQLGTESDLQAQRLPTWPLALGYLALFLLLDWVSYIRPFQGLNVTAWNPQSALAIALLVWGGQRWMGVVWSGLVLAEVAVRGLPADWLVALTATASLTLCYALIARVVSLRSGARLVLGSRADLAWLGAVCIGGALLNGTVYLTALAAGGRGPSGPLYEAIARYGVGDAVGLLVTLPVLLMLMDWRRRNALVAALRGREWWVMAVLVVVVVVIAFGREGHDHFKYFYLLFLPVVWTSARMGLAGAVLAAATTQVAVIVAVQSVAIADLFELQVLMAAVTLTGLMLGVVVDERERAARELEESLRLAAAGQMAAALAHELSQPLTALSSYAKAARLVVALPETTDADRLARLTDIAGRMAEDAVRASEVVKRLRDFFRFGSTRLQPTDLPRLLDEAIAAARPRAGLLGVRIDVDVAPDLPAILIDRVQIAVVLRNLIANALDAASAQGGGGVVTLLATRGPAGLLLEVKDSGAGIDAARLQALFEPGPSAKPGGMGVGLSICRAIVEAHGGALWALSAGSGHLCMSLPLREAAEETE